MTTPNKRPCLLCEKRRAKILPGQKRHRPDSPPLFCSQACAVKFAVVYGEELFAFNPETGEWDQA